MPDCFDVHILQGVLLDARKLCPDYTAGELALDLQTIRLRRMAEGESFVTKTLSQVRKAFLRSLEVGAFTPLPSFKKRRRGGSLPAFLHGLFNAVFDESGLLKPSPCGNSIKVILQLTSLFCKLEGACLESRKYEQIDSFIALDAECAHPRDFSPMDQAILELASGIIGRVFDHFDHRAIKPRPGSGAEAGHLAYFERWQPSVVPLQVNEVYDYSAYHFLSDRHLFDNFKIYMDAEFHTDIAARMEAVPKDSENWRLICVVANGYMFMQQGLKDLLYRHIEHHPITRGHVNFTDQTINGRLAYESSVNLRYATLDMKDASDRIMKWHVRHLFKKVPDLLRVLLSLAENYIEVPTVTGERRVMDCNKFAPMGSALCFPVMSVVHYALLSAIVYFVAEPHDAIKASRDIYVYGDDLLVRSKYAKDVIDIMERFGLKFNPSKCYIESHFRESCGVDAFDGILVTPVRFKKRLLMDPCAETITAYLSYEGDLFSKGFSCTARILRHHLRTTFFKRRWSKFRVPFAVHPATGVIAWQRESSAFCERFNALVDRKHKRFSRMNLKPWADLEKVAIDALAWYDDDVTSVEVAQSDNIEACFTSGWEALFHSLLAKEQDANTVLVQSSPGKIARRSIVRSSMHGRSLKRGSSSIQSVRLKQCSVTVSNRPRDLAMRQMYLRLGRGVRM